MATVCEVLTKKGSQVYTIDPPATVLKATQLMNYHKIGALVVMDGPRVVGMFTERDVLRRVVAEGRDPVQTRVEEVMTTDVACAQAHTTLEEAASVMKNRRIRHLPVFDADDSLEGLVSIGDLNAWKTDGQETTIRFLSEYIPRARMIGGKSAEVKRVDRERGSERGGR